MANRLPFNSVEGFSVGQIPANVVLANGDIITGNLQANANITANGNITANFFLGNGSQLTGISATTIQNGNSNVQAYANANIAISSAGNANILVVTGTGANIAGTLSASGNVTVGNIGAAAGTFTTVTGSLTTPAQPNITSTGTLTSLSVSGNSNIGNIGTGLITATGNITGDYFIGNGSQLTGITVSAGNSIVNGTSNVYIAAADGNVTVTSNGTYTWTFDDTGKLTVPGNINLGPNTIEGIEGNLTLSTEGGPILQSLFGLPVAIRANNNQWLFSGSGNLVLPANTFSVNYRNGAPVILDSIQSSIANGTSNVDIATADGAVTITSNTQYVWSFDDTGNLALPEGGNLNIYGGKVQQGTNTDLNIIVQDQNDDGWALLNTVTDGDDNTLSRTRLTRDEFRITTDFQGADYNWIFNNAGNMSVPGNIAGVTGENTSIYTVDDGDSGSVELKTISFVDETLGSNIRVTQTNATISTNNATHTWTFDNTGNLTLPGNINGIVDATVGITGYTQGVIPAITLTSWDPIIDAPNTVIQVSPTEVNIITDVTGSEHIWKFDDTGNLTLPTNSFSVNYANGTQVPLGGGGSNISNGTSNVNISTSDGDVVVTSDGTNSWKFGTDGVLTVPGNIQTYGFPFNSGINGISRALPAAVYVNGAPFPESSPVTGQVTISDVVGTTEANGTWYFKSADVDIFELFTDEACTIPVDGTTWTIYDSGGLAVSGPYGNISITGGNVEIVTNTGNTWKFSDSGNLTLPANTFAINYANGDQVQLGGSGSNISNGTSNVDIATADGNVTVTSNGTHTWTFDDTGNLVLPGGNSVIYNGYPGIGENPNWTSLVSEQVWLTNPSGNIYAGIDQDTGIHLGYDDGVNNPRWLFDNTGNLTLPLNTFAVNYANGDPVQLGGGGSNISNGTSTVDIATTDGNVTITSGGSSTWTFDTTGNTTLPGNMSITGDIIPSSNITYDLGTSTNRFKDLWLSNSTIYIGEQTISANATNVIFSGVIAGNANGLTNIPAANIVGNAGNFNSNFANFAGNLINGDNSFVLDSDGNVVFQGDITGNAVNRGLVWDYGANADGVNSEVRQDNSGLTVRAWTEVGISGVYSAPVNIVTNQDANAKTWIFDGAGNLTLPGDLRLAEGNIQSNVITPAFNSSIIGINSGNATVIITIADDIFEGPFSGQVTISGVNPPLQANGNWWYQAIEINEFQLFTDANLTIPVDGTDWPGYVDGGTAVGSATYTDLTVQGGNVTIGSNTDTWIFGSDGNLTLPQGGIVHETSIPFGGLSGNTIALKPSGGTDADQQLLVYPTAGQDFNHLHLTSGNLYNTELFLGDDNFNIKLANTGNIVITTNDDTGNIGTWTFGSDGNLTLPANTFSVNYANGSPVVISGGGGNTGNVTFDDNIVIGTGDEFGSDGLYLAPGNSSIANSAVQYLRVRGGDYPTHIHLDTGNNEYYDQYFGADSRYVKLEANGNIVINADDYNGNSGTWNFDVAGNLTVPGNIQSITTGFPFNSTIIGITTGDPTVIVTLDTSPFPNAFVNGQVTISSVVGTIESNGTWYFEATETNEFQLYNDQALTSPVDGTTWTAYVSGGTAVAQGYSNISITGGNIEVITNTGDTWTFSDTGVLTVPGNIFTDGHQVTGTSGYLDLNGDGYVQLAGGTSVNAQITSNGNDWTFENTGRLTLPSISLGEGINEQTVISSQRKIIPAFRWSAAISDDTPTVVYTATDTSITSMKVTMQVQHQGLGFEMFDVSATGTSGDTYYTVTNRLQPPTISPTNVLVDYNGSDQMQITLTVNSGVAQCWVTYDSTEFGIPND